MTQSASTTKRLYRDESYQTSFTATVQAIEALEENKGFAIVLDQTLFYATAGGQPNDVGILKSDDGNETHIIDVQNSGDDTKTIIHITKSAPSFKVGDSVEGSIDWARRFKHMQRHTAQHLLSQAFMRQAERFSTVSVSIGSAGLECNLDLEAEPTQADLEAVEKLVNEVMYQNLQVDCFEVDESEIANYPLRRPPKVAGKIRLVKMGEWEVSACGGTHLRGTAEAGPIKLLRTEHIRGDLTRVSFCCGLEVLQDYGLKHVVSQDLARNFSSKVEQLPERIQALQQTVSEQKQHITSLEKELTEFKVLALLDDALTIGDTRVLVRDASEDSISLKAYAAAFGEVDNVVALLGQHVDGKVQLLCLRGSSVAVDMREVLKGGLEPISGRGGGKPESAQGAGTGTKEDLANCLEGAIQVVKEALA